jgi:hypothetical protein
MKIEEFYGNVLVITSKIHFADLDDESRIPYVKLFVLREVNTDVFHDNPMITIAVYHDDHFNNSSGMQYKVNSENFFSVLNELINWMCDHEKGAYSFDELLTYPYCFLPECGCERRYC